MLFNLSYRIKWIQSSCRAFPYSFYFFSFLSDIFCFSSWTAVFQWQIDFRQGCLSTALNECLHSKSVCPSLLCSKDNFAGDKMLGSHLLSELRSLSCRRLPSSILAEKSTVDLTSSPDEAASRLLRCHGILRFSIWPVTSLRQFSLINILYRFVPERRVALFLKIFKKSLIYLFK